ncbi:MAG TPA: phosphatase PAP2 family protein [Opitutaceae bacterium]|jgi:membrane-associated phospholipid phosphatase|nr:phosphatase PAP2 family protein [Opitutaceae bacterium]
MPTRSSARAVLLLGLAATLVCLFWLDRPASSWAFGHLHGARIFVLLTHGAEGIDGGSLAAVVVLGAAAIFFGFRPGPRSLLLLRTALSVFVALAAREILGIICGRTWPETFIGNPSWIRDGAYGFHFLHGGEGWDSFPSGHTAATAAFAAALWHQAPRLRILWLGIVLLVAGGLYCADYHFLGDICAGATVGILSAQGVLALFRPEPAEAGAPPRRG